MSEKIYPATMPEANYLELDQHKIDLIKQTVCKGASNDELQLFLHVCQRTGLDPFMKQIYSIPRGGQRTIQISIDGLRVLAERTGRYAPGKEPTFNYDKDGRLISATAYIKKQSKDSTWHEVSASAYFEEYNAGTNFWKKMPHNQLAKCAESLALRKAFPAELAGLYSTEEMEQAGSTPIEVQVQISEEEYLSSYGEEKENMRKFLNLVSSLRSWTKEQTIAEFEKNRDITIEKFEKWKDKEKARELAEVA